MAIATIIEVADRTRQVRQAAVAAITALDNQFLGGQAADESIAVIRALQPNIEAWALRGEDAAGKSVIPASGWDGWLRAGQVFLDGIHDVHDLGKDGALASLSAQVADSPRETLKAVERARKKSVKLITDTITETENAIVQPLLLPLILLAVVVGGYLYLRVRK